MVQRVEFGERANHRGQGGLLLPVAVLALLLVWHGILCFTPPATGFHLEWGAWLVLWLDVQLAAFWLWRRAAGLRRT